MWGNRKCQYWELNVDGKIQEASTEKMVSSLRYELSHFILLQVTMKMPSVYKHLICDVSSKFYKRGFF